MLQILNEEYYGIAPQAPSKKALAVFKMEDARIAFQYGNCDFVVALDENTLRFAYCFSLRECEIFWNSEDNHPIYTSPTLIEPVVDGEQTEVKQYKVVAQDNSSPFILFTGTHDECLKWKSKNCLN